MDRPSGRHRHVTGEGKGVSRRGSGIGAGPVGTGSGRRGNSGNDGFAGGTSGKNRGRLTGMGSGGMGPGGPFFGGMVPGGRRRGGCSRYLFLVILFVIVIFIVDSCSNGLLSDDSGTGFGNDAYSYNNGTGDTGTAQADFDASDDSGSSYLSQLLGLDSYESMTGTSPSWSKRAANTGTLNTEVAAGARDKFTKQKGDGTDTVTVMVYMCGADLESRNGMATSDLQEMIAGKPGDQLNLIVYTGGAAKWQNNAVSSGVCQIWKVENGGLRKLVSDDGDRSMTDPSTLTRFIQFCSKNYPADRNELIFWDHGGGSVTGYGYDEKHSAAGSMDLAEIHTAIQDGGVKFDFIGFDACLMATAENALSLADCGDYLLASEETEPGTGWYYTNWVRDLSDSPAMSTLELGKEIIDDFTKANASSYGSSGTTLSLVDLAELSATLPQEFKAFAQETLRSIKNDGYAAVSTARGSTREFAQSSKIDQVDLVNLADNLGTDTAEQMAGAVLSAVKYNQVSGSMSNAYGLSIYFPYKNLRYVDAMTDTYKEIGIDDTYSDCIRSFAKMEASGQAVQSSQSPIEILSGGTYQSLGSNEIGQLISALLGGDLSGTDIGEGRFLRDTSLSDDSAISYIEGNRFDASKLIWKESGRDGRILSMDENNWKLTNKLEENLFVDDGEGYIDLGLERTYDFTDDGALIADESGAWLAVDSQPVAYYHIDTTGDTTTGRIPVLLNSEYADLIVTFDSENPDGYIAGASYDYRDGETDTLPKSLVPLSDGDTIDFIADYYTYGGDYNDTYRIGDETTVRTGSDGTLRNLSISDVIVPEKLSVSYRFTDTYGATYWTEAIAVDNAR